MGTITNNYRDSHVLNLGSGGERGPYLVTQTGVAPNDPLPRERMFVLRPDGRWVDLNAYVCQGKPEVMDEIVFTTTTQIMETFGKLFGSPRVLDLPIESSTFGNRDATAPSARPIGFIVAGIDIGSCIRAIFAHMRFVDLSLGISVSSVSSFTRQQKKMNIGLEH